MVDVDGGSGSADDAEKTAELLAEKGESGGPSHISSEGGGGGGGGVGGVKFPLHI